MSLTFLSLFLSVCAVIASFLSVILLRKAFANAVRSMHSTRPAPCSCGSALQSLRESQQETSDALQTLANRVKMMRVRNAANHVGESNTIDPSLSIKDQLRVRAKLVAGQPARHE